MQSDKDVCERERGYIIAWTETERGHLGLTDSGRVCLNERVH